MYKNTVSAGFMQVYAMNAESAFGALKTPPPSHSCGGGGVYINPYQTIAWMLLSLLSFTKA